MRRVDAPLGTGSHRPRPEGVLIVGRHAGLLEQGVLALAREGYRAAPVLYDPGARDAVAEAVSGVAEAISELEALGSDPRVLVVGGAVPAAARPLLRAQCAVRWPDLVLVEHRGSLQCLFEEVLAVLGADPT